MSRPTVCAEPMKLLGPAQSDTQRNGCSPRSSATSAVGRAPASAPSAIGTRSVQVAADSAASPTHPGIALPPAVTRLFTTSSAPSAIGTRSVQVAADRRRLSDPPGHSVPARQLQGSLRHQGRLASLAASARCGRPQAAVLADAITPSGGSETSETLARRPGAYRGAIAQTSPPLVPLRRCCASPVATADVARAPAADVTIRASARLIMTQNTATFPSLISNTPVAPQLRPVGHYA